MKTNVPPKAESNAMDRRTLMQISKELDYRPQTATSLLAAGAVAAGLALAIWLSFSGSIILYILGQLLLAVFMHHSFLIVHECVHETFVANKNANIVLGYLFSIPALVPYWGRRIEHLQHHAFVGHIERDGATARGVASFLDQSALRTAVLKISWRVGFPILALNEHIGLWRLAYGALFEAKKGRMHFLLSIMFPIAALVLLLVSIGWFGALMLVPAVLGYFFIIELVNLPHHFDSEIYSGDVKPLWEHHTLTKSCYAPPLVARYLLLNFNYHIEHHLLPKLPWQRLDEVHPQIKAVLGEEYMMTDELTWYRDVRGQSYDEAFKKYITAVLDPHEH